MYFAALSPLPMCLQMQQAGSWAAQGGAELCSELVRFWEGRDAGKHIKSRQPLRLSPQSPGGNVVKTLEFCQFEVLLKIPIYLSGYASS